MRKIYCTLALLLVLPILALPAVAQTPDELMDRFVTAWNADDAAAIEAMLADDVIYFDAHEMEEGRNPVATSWRGARDASDEMRITTLRSGGVDDLAYHVGRWELIAEGRTEWEGVYTFIFQQGADETWRIVSAHVEDTGEAEAPAASP